jgi:hypothetical protein
VRVATALILAATLYCAVSSPAAAADFAPTTTPASDQVAGLIAKLADPDFRVRRDASARLRELGPAALPGLKQAAQGQNAEIRARAGEIVHLLEYQPVPGRPAHHGYTRQRQVSFRIINGRQSVEVDDEGRKISIIEDDDGIRMTVSGETDGQPVTRTYAARTAEQLRAENAEAYAVYERFSHGGGQDAEQAANNVFVQGNGQIIVVPRFQPVPMVVAQGGDDLNGLRNKVDDEMEKAKLSPLQKAQVHGAIDRVEQTRDLNPVATPVDQEDDRIARYDKACDELRKILTDNKLPDPGDALPPPKSARLGVNVEQERLSGTVTVTHVLPHSRADKLGLQDDDIVRKINGKEVADVKDLRRLVTENSKNLVVEVTRDGREVRLEEPK